MPFAYLTRDTQASLQSLEEQLVQEWRQPGKDVLEPVIIEERERGGGPPDVYVIWQAWTDLSRSERTQVILNAYEQRYGREASLQVMVALGFTSEEAHRNGIRYAPLEPAA